MRSIIILGAGGHAKVLIDVLNLRGMSVIGLTDADPAKLGSHLSGIPIIGGDEAIYPYDCRTVSLVNGVGSVRVSALRKNIFELFKKREYEFAAVIHPSVIVAAGVELAEGVQVMAGVILQPGSKVGVNSIINTNAIVDHDCVIEAHVHIAPGSILSGAVRVGAGSHIGAGATIIQGVQIGENCMIAAGAVVTQDISSGSTVAGVPARAL